MNNLYKKILNFYGRNQWLGYIFIIIFGLIYFGLMQASKTFMDPDSFYHTRITELFMQRGVIKSLPWLVFTELPEIFTDHHFLYHIFLIPFIYKITPLIGVKVATVVINTTFITLFYTFLKSLKIKYSAFFILILLSGAPFIFRINLVKASGFSLIFIMLILLTIFKRRYFWLGLISFFYVWAYGGWPLSIILAGIFFIASFIGRYILGSKFWQGIKMSEWKPLLATMVGSIAGLVINPYFSQNLKFYWIQIVQIAVVNYKTKIGVGAEWYGFNFAELLTYSGAILIPLLAGFLFFVGRMMVRKKITVTYEMVRDVFFFAITAGFFFTLAIKSRRNAEYAFPFIVMFSATMLHYFKDRDVYRFLKDGFIKVFRLEILYKIFLGYIAFMLLLAFSINGWRIKTELAKGFVFDEYKKEMNVAMDNSSEGDIIFHSDWDDWPMLFYHNIYNRYIIGLDPTFMYKYDPEIYKKWRDITWGNFEGDPHSILINDFNAKIIFIGKYDKEDMDRYFKDDSRYKLLYDGGEDGGKVYKVQ